LTDPSIDRVLGRALTGVGYYNVPTLGWEVAAPIHVVDYGVELDFDGSYVSLYWQDGTYELGAANSPLGGIFPSAERTEIASAPWDAITGTRLVSAQVGYGASPCEPGHRWVAQLAFDGDARIWIAAASYFEDGNMLIPCSDEIVIAWSGETARSYRLLVQQN
jgi:hypothetical protein